MGEGEGKGVGEGCALAADSWTFLVSICRLSVETSGAGVSLEDIRSKRTDGTTIAATPMTESISLVFLSMLIVKCQLSNVT